MNCFTIRQQYNPQIPSVHFFDSRPAANPTIGLDDFFHGMFDNILNPFQANVGAVRPFTNDLKVVRELHNVIG